ncbi:MAG TPA: dienelactone hydrolase family protein [Xanthomonadales bacterium]|nr:dienelactone hydrolase family protein [Xanthomonadales bacterium]
MIRRLTRTLRVDDGAFRAYVARPDAGDAPAVVVLHEVFGVNDGMKARCDELAADGYVAVCPDLFWRIEPGVALDDRSAAGLARAAALYDAFDLEHGVADIVATIDAIRRETLGSEGVAVLGYCLGGLLAYLVAARTRVDAAVSYYGVGIDDHLAAAEALHAPLLMHLAGEDRFVPPAAQERIVEALSRRAGVEIHRYPRREHAFARRGGAHFDADDAALADARTAAFLAAHLHPVDAGG